MEENPKAGRGLPLILQPTKYRTGRLGTSVAGLGQETKSLSQLMKLQVNIFSPFCEGPWRWRNSFLSVPVQQPLFRRALHNSLPEAWEKRRKMEETLDSKTRLWFKADLRMTTGLHSQSWRPAGRRRSALISFPAWHHHLPSLRVSPPGFYSHCFLLLGCPFQHPCRSRIPSPSSSPAGMQHILWLPIIITAQK